MRAQINRRRRNQRLILVSVVVVVAALVIVGAYYLSTLSTGGSSLIGKQVSASDYRGLYQASQTGYSNTNQTLMTKVQSINGTPYTSGGKPLVVYIGADYCPYCAFQRWPLIMALMRFGNFTNLSYMQSAPSPEVFPDSPTFSFYGSTYTSKYIAFQGFELVARDESTPLASLPSNYTGPFQQYGGSAYPFINIADRYAVSGAFYFPDQLDGKNWTQIIQLISTNSVVSNEIVSSANAITAAICKATPNAPSSVCGNTSISQLATQLTAYNPSPSGSLQVTTQLENPTVEAKFLTV